MKQFWFFLAVLTLTATACSQSSPAATYPVVNRYNLLPETKYSPENDYWPPVAAQGWSQPMPLPFPVNTSGGEDSPFITPDGKTLYFFFTPDVSIPVQRQLTDGVTGIWATHLTEGSWSEPERVWLEDPDDVSMDGCEFITGNLMYFCTIRTGFTSIQWYQAELWDGSWRNWQPARDEPVLNEYQVGELHISADGQELFFHSTRGGGLGGLDIWVSQMTPNGWGEPTNLGPGINTTGNEGWPSLSQDEKELWYLGDSRSGYPGPAIYMSLSQPDGSWGPGVEVISSFAGEPTLSADGQTLYFVHHYYSQDLQTMLEADIYVSQKLP